MTTQQRYDAKRKRLQQKLERLDHQEERALQREARHDAQIARDLAGVPGHFAHGLNFYKLFWMFFLCCFLGVITGIGGGILRDILARKMPGVFVKHIYAVASIIGAVITGVLWPVSSDIAMMAGFAAVVIIRICAAEGRWNLPHIEGIEGP